MMMSAGSVVLALAPTERAVGAWAAVILVVVSLLQGIATGGEYAAATVLLSESGTRGHRGFFASFQAGKCAPSLARSIRPTPHGERILNYIQVLCEQTRCGCLSSLTRHIRTPHIPA